jgi:hypothetical protein
MKKKTTRKKTTIRTKRRPNAENYSEVTKSLGERLKTRAPVDYDRGRDRMRRHLEEAFSCTPTRARHIVSSLVQKGYVRFGPHPIFQHDHTVGCWTYHPSPST